MTLHRLVLLRHGQTDWNVSRTYQGQHDVPLNQTGREQARAAAAALAGLGVDRVVASPLSRAAETAGMLATAAGVDVETDHRLTEIDVGSWVGWDMERAYREDPGFAAAMREGLDYRRSLSGETAAEVGERVGGALRDVVASSADGSTVVVVSHGLAIRMGACALLGWGYELSLQLAAPRNCHWGVLEPAHSGGWRLMSWNLAAPGFGGRE